MISSKELPSDVKEMCKTVSFTEALFNQIRHITSVQIPYGIAFKKNFLRSQKGNPVLYLHQNEQKYFCDAMINYINLPINKNIYPFNTLKSYFYYILAFIKLVNDSQDFSLLREWMVIGDFYFSSSDVIIVADNFNDAELIYRMTGQKYYMYYSVEDKCFYCSCAGQSYCHI